MELTLSKHDRDAIVYQLRLALRKDLQDMLSSVQQPEMVTTAEAARLLGITPDRLRHIVCEDPGRYPHIKRGGSKQSKLMFERRALLQCN